MKQIEKMNNKRKGNTTLNTQVFNNDGANFHCLDIACAPKAYPSVLWLPVCQQSLWLPEMRPNPGCQM